MSPVTHTSSSGAHATRVVTDPETAVSFASGLTPSSAIAITDDINVDEEEVSLDALLDVSTGIYIEKEIAADTIGTIFAATKKHFLNYVEPCALELITLLQHFYEGIRKSATDSLLEIIRTFYDLSEPQEWQPGYAVSLFTHVHAIPKS